MMEKWLMFTTILTWGAGLAICGRDFRLGHRRKSAAAWGLFLIGWLAQFAWLYLHGVNAGRCPIGTLPEILTFISWALAGTCLALNLVYRSNALAMYAISVTTLFQILTILLPVSSPGVEKWLRSSWLGVHASLSVLAYAAFALSAVLAIMYLLEDRQLKTRQMTAGTMTFPAVAKLELWMSRVVFAGFLLFTGGLLTGFLWFENLPPAERCHDYKICWTVTVWLAYFGLILAHRFGWLRRRNTAWLYVILTTLTMLTFWGINRISAYHSY